MATRFDKTAESPNSINGGYEGNTVPHDYVIPSCGIEDVDYGVFNLFDKQIPLFYELNNEMKRVPVIFATGERFALLRRKKPITDRTGALILPLISITRNAIENVPQKGVANNQMFPETLIRRIAKNNMEHRQLNNFEGFESIKHTTKVGNRGFSLNPKTQDNIYETIEMPPVKYFGVSYEVTIWSSFTQQMNDLITAIMSAYTLNPGQQFKLESEKGYWFPGFIDSSFSQDTNYADYTDAERYIKYSMTLGATGYIIAPNIQGGKVGLRSYVSAPKVNFEVLGGYEDIDPTIKGIQSADPNARIFDDVSGDDLPPIAQAIGLNDAESLEDLHGNNQSGVKVSSGTKLKPYDALGEKSTDHSKKKKIFLRDESGKVVAVKGTKTSAGEVVFDQKYAEVLLNISNISK